MRFHRLLSTWRPVLPGRFKHQSSSAMLPRLYQTRRLTCFQQSFSSGSLKSALPLRRRKSCLRRYAKGYTDIVFREDIGIGRSREGLYIPGLKSGVFRPSPLPTKINRSLDHLFKSISASFLNYLGLTHLPAVSIIISYPIFILNIILNT